MGIEEDKESTAIAEVSKTDMLQEEIGRRTQASPTHAHGKEVFLSEAKISFKSRDTINPLTSLTSPKREKRGRRKAIPLKREHPTSRQGNAGTDSPDHPSEKRSP